ncbi:MAG: general secretion pathway protein GspB [Desulfuromusa sp.]|nr:general secretion pathway protein GspB [Desulfuromusa sp.]
MSFILEALKKSENKHRKNSGRNPRTIHEPMPRKNGRSRFWVLGILLLLVNAALLFSFFGRPWQPAPASQPTQVISTDTAQVKTNKLVSAPPQTVSATEQNNIAPTPQKIKEQPAVKALPVPRNDKQVYTFGQLPVSIQKKIPPLQMSLHAYNRADASSSMVQLNDRIMREGATVTDNIRLEKITADGVVLRYDGYLFLLPRRGN